MDYQWTFSGLSMDFQWTSWAKLKTNGLILPLLPLPVLPVLLISARRLKALKASLATSEMCCFSASRPGMAAT